MDNVTNYFRPCPVRCGTGKNVDNAEIVDKRTKKQKIRGRFSTKETGPRECE